MNAPKIGLWSATFLGISTIIGSGWLFAPYKAAAVAGPAAILSWVVGAFIISLLALCFTEIAALYPMRGLSAIIPTLSHNKYFGFPFALANWLGIVAVVALEADATIQYLIQLVPTIAEHLFTHGQLTLWGGLLAFALILLFFLANFWGVRVLAKTNNIFTLIKIIIPIVTALCIISVAFHRENFTAIGGTLAPYGYGSVFSAILTCGIVVAFNGFQTVISFANEVKNPTRNIRLSVALAIGFCLIVYLLLQIAFIGGVPTSALAHGWNHLNYVAPMVDLPILLGLTYLSSIVYFGATIAPCGSGVAFTGSGTRMFTAMARQGQMPKLFDSVHPVYSISRRSLILNTLLSTMFLFLFPSWGEMALVLGLLHVLSYLPIPLALIVFRNKLRVAKTHPFRVPYGRPIALFTFVVFTCLFAMSTFKPARDLFVMFAIFQVIFIALQVKSMRDFGDMIRQSGMLMLFFVGLFLLIWAAPQNTHLLSYRAFIITAVIFSVLSFFALCYSERNDAELINVSVNIYR